MLTYTVMGVDWVIPFSQSQKKVYYCLNKCLRAIRIGVQHTYTHRKPKTKHTYGKGTGVGCDKQQELRKTAKAIKRENLEVEFKGTDVCLACLTPKSKLQKKATKDHK